MSSRSGDSSAPPGVPASTPPQKLRADKLEEVKFLWTLFKLRPVPKVSAARSAHEIVLCKTACRLMSKSECAAWADGDCGVCSCVISPACASAADLRVCLVVRTRRWKWPGSAFSSGAQGSRPSRCRS